MIFSKEKNYATVWEVKPAEKYIDLRISTSEKDKDSGEYRNSNWNARLVGHAMNSLKDIKEKDRIEFTSSKITNELYTDKEGNKKNYLRILIFEAQAAGNKTEDESKKTETTKEPSKKAATGKAQPKVETESDPW